MDANSDEPQSLLVNLRQHHVVEVHNPLSDDFTWPVARSVVHLDPQDKDPHLDALRLRNDSHPTMKHVQQKITIPSGKNMKLPGDVAQVVVKHLVDEILSREGQKSNIGDPTLRRTKEEDVIQNTEDLVSRMSTQTVEEQLEQQIKDLNREDPTPEVDPSLPSTNTENLPVVDQGAKPDQVKVATHGNEPAFPELSKSQ